MGTGWEHKKRPRKRYPDGFIAVHSTKLRFEELIELLPQKGSPDDE